MVSYFAMFFISASISRFASSILLQKSTAEFVSMARRVNDFSTGSFRFLGRYDNDFLERILLSKNMDIARQLFMSVSAYNLAPKIPIFERFMRTPTCAMLIKADSLLSQLTREKHAFALSRNRISFPTISNLPPYNSL